VSRVGALEDFHAQFELHTGLLPTLAGAEAMRGEPLDWDALVPRAVHPIRIAALEAMQWIDEPFSAVDLDRMHDDPPGVETVAYHMRVMAFDQPVLRLYGEETIRGATRKLYYFRKRTPASKRGKRVA
jgi:hypothetical protein